MKGRVISSSSSSSFFYKQIAVGDAIRTSLGPRGMDKMVIEREKERGGTYRVCDVTSNIPIHRFKLVAVKLLLLMTVPLFSSTWLSFIQPPRWYIENNEHMSNQHTNSPIYLNPLLAC